MEVGKVEIEIEVSKKKFKISFVSNWVIYQYEQMNKKLAKLQALYNRLELIPPKSEILVIVEEVRELAENSLDDRLEIIKEILEGNDIEFVRKWWERKTDASDINRFIMLCAFKDATNSKKKVKAN